jgi:hypothetical protein
MAEQQSKSMEKYSPSEKLRLEIIRKLAFYDAVTAVPLGY